MILKALYDYYQRSKDLAPEGFEPKEIPFLIRIDKDGNFQELEDMRMDKKQCKSFQVVKNNGRTSAPMPNILWDNVEYVLNFTENHLLPQQQLTNKEEAKRLKAIGKSNVKNQLFIDKVLELASHYPQNEAFRAVALFYKKKQLDMIRADRLWKEIEKKPTVNLSFRLEGEDEIVAEDDDLADYITSSSKNDTGPSEDYPVCLITGEKAEPVATTTATMIPGSQATAKLVAFQVKSGYDSFGNLQGLNAPISKKAEAAYTTALNRLLAKDSPNKFMIGNRTFVFWASNSDEAAKAVEAGMTSLFSHIKEEDNPNKRIEEVKEVFKAIYSGVLRTNPDDRFYILGLAPNSARIAVVYWNETTLKDFSKNIWQHFEDINIADTRKEQRPYYGLHQMLRSVAFQSKNENIPPNLPEATVKSIFQGTPYPDTLFHACLQRIRATQEIGITRAAILKAYNNRKYKNLKLKVMLDKENTSPGYLCGRLFATLEYLQEKSSGINTILEKYMNAASGTPATVFPTLLNLSIHHVEKLKREGQYSKDYFERKKREIIDKIPADGFPTHLDLREQGRFMVGYYHQRQYYYTSRKITTDKE